MIRFSKAHVIKQKQKSHQSELHHTDKCGLYVLLSPNQGLKETNDPLCINRGGHSLKSQHPTYNGKTCGDRRHPLFQMGNLSVRNTQVIQHVREGNSHCPTLLLPWRPRQVLLPKPDPLAAPPTAAGTPAWASHGRRPGWKVRGAERASPAHRVGSRAAAGRVAPGSPAHPPGPPPPAAPHPAWGLRRRRRSGDTHSRSAPTCPSVRWGAARLLPHPGRGAVAPAAEHFRVPRHLRGPSALHCCPLVGAQGTSRWLSGGAAARSLGKQPRDPKVGSGIRGQEWRLGCSKSDTNGRSY